MERASSSSAAKRLVAQHLLTMAVFATVSATAVVGAQDRAPTAPHGTVPQHRVGTRWFATQQLVGLLNPMGAEHRFDVGLRWNSGANAFLLQDSHVAFGATSYVSPVYAIGGAFVQAQPLAFLVLRADWMGIGVWPIGLQGAGHYGLLGYDASLSSANLPAERALSAAGWTASVSATLQAAVELNSSERFVLTSDSTLSYTSLGAQPYYYSMRSDLILAQRDWLFCNNSFVGYEARRGDSIYRLGVYDDARYVLASGYLGFQLGPVGMVELLNVTPTLPSLTLFVRAGYYTHHAIRAEQATVLGGVAIDWDFGSI